MPYFATHGWIDWPLETAAPKALSFSALHAVGCHLMNSPLPLTFSPPEQADLVALVIPVFNEAVDIADHLRCILNTLDSLPAYRFRVVVVDDGSADETPQRVADLQRLDARLQLLVFTRNFGKEAAILAGLIAANEADSDAAIVMDSDLQHPPALIPQMLALWKQGMPVVEGVKTQRSRESWLTQISALGFYQLFGTLSGIDLRGRTDYKLLDKQVVHAYLALPERNRFFRGLVSWMGFTSAQIPFVVPQRELRGSRWSRWRLWRYALSAITSFSARPLHIITGLGVVTLSLSVVVGIKALVDRVMGVAVEGFTTVILLQLFLGGALMISLGLIGLYVARLHDEVKARPNYLIDWQRGGVRTSPKEDPVDEA